MKKISILLVLICVFLFVGCGNKTETKSTVDYDLTKMNLEMKSATFTQICNNYTENLGKTIKIDGFYDCMKAESETYHLIVFMDSTGCCPYYMEWVSKDNTYPNIQDDIIITGTLESYLEGDTTYIHLANATMEKIEK